MNIFEIEVHPSADIYPMIPTDELQQLADDILQNGMLNPIVVDNSNGAPVLIDGRNRLAACRLAEIDSDDIEYIEFEGVDVNSFIITSNDKRRHMTKGQRAMAIAMMYPEQKMGRGNKVPKDLGLSAEYLRQARTILSTLPVDADMVLSGSTPLSEAYKEAKDEKRKGNTEDELFQWLRDNHPELADMVVEGALGRDAAMMEARQRDANAKANRFATAQMLKGFLSHSDSVLSTANDVKSLEKLIGHKKEFEKNVGMSVGEMSKKVSALQSGIKSIVKYIGDIK